MVDEDFVEEFEEEEALLAHVDANEGCEIDIDTLVDRIAGITTRSYEECVCVCWFVLLNRYWGIVTVPGSVPMTGDLGWPNPHPPP